MSSDHRGPAGGSQLLTPRTNDASKHMREPIIALVGTPNSGKTTLYNQLTGLRQKVANYPGVTVEKHLGRVKL